MMTDAGKMFDALRRGLLGPKLDQQEVDGTNAIVAACAGWPLSWAAYALATAYHETAGTMMPIKEFGGANYFWRKYDIEGANKRLARELGNIHPGDGAKYAGRGYVQLTGRRNYHLAGQKLGGLDLIKIPDLAMQPAAAARIMRHGMAEGWFTGKSLADYLPRAGSATRDQFRAARRIINGTDKAQMIAGYAMQFQAALIAGGWRR